MAGGEERGAEVVKRDGEGCGLALFRGVELKGGEQSKRAIFRKCIAHCEAWLKEEEIRF
jgi:hypothetical protein